MESQFRKVGLDMSTFISRIQNKMNPFESMTSKKVENLKWQYSVKKTELIDV